MLDEMRLPIRKRAMTSLCDKFPFVRFDFGRVHASTFRRNATYFEPFFRADSLIKSWALVCKKNKYWQKMRSRQEMVLECNYSDVEGDNDDNESAEDHNRVVCKFDN